MNTEGILKDFKKKVCDQIILKSLGKNRYIVLTPFTFEDGDVFKIILQKEGDAWSLTDEGHTLMHLSYDELDLDSGRRRELFSQALKRYYLEDDEGEIKTKIEKNAFGDALYSFIQGIMRIVDLEYTARPTVASLFMEDFKIFLQEKIKQEKEFDYTYQKEDPKGYYPVDCKIKMPKTPIHVFGATNNDRCKNIALTCYFLREHDIRFFAITIFENQEDLSQKVITQLNDAIDKPFSTLDYAKKRLPNLIDDLFMGQAI